DAVAAWPEFNLFTRGYVLSRLDFDDERYAAAVADQWNLLDRCADSKVDRKSANFAPFMRLEVRKGPKRVCWNSWIAPHGFEGFFLNMGDRIGKAGAPETARHVYRQAKLAREYSSWRFQDVLERRIAQARENVALFRNPPKQERERRMMFETPFACV